MRRLTCPGCGGTFEVPTGRGYNRRRYCSKVCARRTWNRCSKQRCRRYANRADGLCAYHMRLERRRQKAWTMADEILDFLAMEGWATSPEIAERFGRHIDSVERVLRQLRVGGQVESRVVELAFAVDGGALESRMEWRACDLEA